MIEPTDGLIVQAMGGREDMLPHLVTHCLMVLVSWCRDVPRDKAAHHTLQLGDSQL